MWGGEDTRPSYFIESCVNVARFAAGEAIKNNVFLSGGVQPALQPV